MTEAVATTASGTPDPSVLEQALLRALDSKGYLDSPLAELAQEILSIEIEGIDNRGETQPRVTRLIEQWAKGNAEWMNKQEGGK